MYLRLRSEFLKPKYIFPSVERHGMKLNRVDVDGKNAFPGEDAR